MIQMSVRRIAALSLAGSLVAVGGRMKTHAVAYYDTNGYEEATLGAIVDDNLSEHITGSIGGSVSFTSTRSGAPFIRGDYVSSPTRDGDRAVQLTMPWNFETNVHGVNLVRHELANSNSGSAPVYYNFSWYIPHNGLTDTVEHALGMHVRIADSAGRVPFGLQPLDNGDIVYIRDNGDESGVVLAGQSFNKWYDVTIEITPDVDPVADGFQRKASVWIDNVKVLEDFTWTETDSRATEPVQDLFMRWQTQGATIHEESEAHPIRALLDNVSVTDANPVPEPGVMGLLGLGLSMMLIGRPG